MRKTVSLLLLVVVALALPAGVVAAGLGRTTLPRSAITTCNLTAQARAGREIQVDGEGFAASTDVTVTQVWGGSNATLNSPGTGTTTTQTVTSDASGAFTFTVPAGPGHGGAYSFTAVAGGCTATVDAVAVETAGGTTGGLSPTPPPTDSVTESEPAVPAGSALPLLALALGAGLLVLAAGILRPRRR